MLTYFAGHDIDAVLIIIIKVSCCQYILAVERVSEILLMAW